jgi:hypothetical protein
MSLDDVADVLANRGYIRIASESVYVWTREMSRVRLSMPSEASFHFPYVIGRQRYEEGPNGRWLHPQTSVLPVERGASAERLADLVEDQLKNPY